MKTLDSMVYMMWLCFLLHLLADFWLQGCLADMKQQEWWQDRLHDMFMRYDGRNKSMEWTARLYDKYKFDYLAALVCHSLMWTILMMLPLMWFTDALSWSLMALANTIIHAWIDQMKANAHRINLVTDQLLHAAQVVATVLILMI